MGGLANPGQVTPECVILTYHGTGERDGDAKP
jgi:hypothetical protein